MKIFLAGATGAIGRPLVPLLLNARHYVIGTTRSTTKADRLRAAGVDPVVVDVFDAQALSAAVLEAHPDIIVHQLTDLPPGLDPSQMAEGTQRNARMRSQGTQNLVAAALGAGVHRLIAQSIAWMYVPGKEPHSEDDPLDIDARGTRAITAAGVATPERLTASSPPIDGVVLRYGHLYGPGTGACTAEGRCTSMPQPPPRRWRWRRLSAASTTSLNQADTSQRRRHSANSVSTRARD